MAKGRTAEAFRQEAILDAVAEMTLGPGANAEALLRAAFDDFGATARRAAGPVRSRSIPFASDRWTPYGLPSGPLQQETGDRDRTCGDGVGIAPGAHP